MRVVDASGCSSIRFTPGSMACGSSWRWRVSAISPPLRKAPPWPTSCPSPTHPSSQWLSRAELQVAADTDMERVELFRELDGDDDPSVILVRCGCWGGAVGEGGEGPMCEATPSPLDP